ncbi:MAG: type I-U CRISPR-associated helicase/endonuclease Cas3 [Acidobacteriaceae bacterium]
MDLSGHEGRFFADSFEALTNHKPLRWQHRLFERLITGKIPDLCILPTGLGKTSAIPIWLIALAAEARAGEIKLPRRLVYIVNRRTVVDQATSTAELLRRRLEPGNSNCMRHGPALADIANALRKSAGSNDVILAVSTLRGELADNEEWKGDPARPAIIVGTIDMIGSKLLFSGYGDGPYWRPQHAGLIGQDSLIVHDEAHLTPSFSAVLALVARAQEDCKEPRPLRIMELSATARKDSRSSEAFGLAPEDYEDETVQRRLNAKKELRINHVKDNEVIGNLVARALSHESEGAKVLIYVFSPTDAQKIASELRKVAGNERVALLTGTIRGYERDRLVADNPVYWAFLNAARVPQSVYLVSTSAGEVGIDLDADHMVCDATTLDAMIQRLGRVNRQGGDDRVATIDVVAMQLDEKARSNDVEEKAGKQKRRSTPELAATVSILSRCEKEGHNGGIDASPAHLRKLLDTLEASELLKAFAPKPVTLPLTEIVLDAWSMTSIRGKLPGRPEVAEYLHGLTSDLPETHVAWRREIMLLKDADADGEAVEAWFHACPVLSHERLRDLTTRVRNTLIKMLQQRRKNDPNRDFPVVVLNERGEAEWRTLSEIAEKDSKIEYRTIVVPTEVGGLNDDGALDSGAENEASDVAEQSPSIRRQRWISITDDTGQHYRRLMTGEVVDPLSSQLRERERIVLVEASEGESEEASRELVLMVGPNELAVGNPETAKFRQALSIHSNFIAAHADRIATALTLDSSLKEALITAARWHDRGKDRDIWQRFACNPNGTETLAKSKKYLHGRALGGYRHEFGSLLDAAADPEIQAHPESDLILHLIAAHHGWARPHFEPKAQDPKHTSRENEEAAGDVMRRFGHLQQRFGRWGLAWLESLLRCADIAASKQRERAELAESPAS